MPLTKEHGVSPASAKQTTAKKPIQFKEDEILTSIWKDPSDWTSLVDKVLLKQARGKLSSQINMKYKSHHY